MQLKSDQKDLEQKITESKRSYSESLKRLEVLNTEIHQRRGTLRGKYLLDPRQVLSTGNSPERTHRLLGSTPMSASVDSLQLGSDVEPQFTGSVGSLRSSEHEHSPSPDSAEKISPSASTSPASPDTTHSTCSQLHHEDSIDSIASTIVDRCLATAVSRLKLEGRPSDT